MEVWVPKRSVQHICVGPDGSIMGSEKFSGPTKERSAPLASLPHRQVLGCANFRIWGSYNSSKYRFNWSGFAKVSVNRQFKSYPFKFKIKCKINNLKESNKPIRKATDFCEVPNRKSLLNASNWSRPPSIESFWRVLFCGSQRNPRLA